MKFFDIAKERIPFYITLAVVIGLGCIYYFMYLPKNEADINRWKFRTLQKIDKNIKEKIEIGQNQLDTYLNSISGKPSLRNNLNEFLKSQRSSNFPVGEITKVPIALHTKNLKQKIENKIEIIQNSGEQIVQKNFSMRTISGLRENRDKVTKSSIELSTSDKTLILTQEKTLGSLPYKLSLNYDFGNFVTPLLSKGVFDHYIILGDSTVLFETFPSGLDVAKDSTLKKNGTLAGAKIINREYGGVLYKLFIQPIRLKNNTNIRVIGLLTNDHFYHAKTRLPPRIVLFLVTIFACIIVTFPIVKLYQLSDQDRLTLSDALSVVIVCMFQMSMVFLVFIKYSPTIIGDQRSKGVLSSHIIREFIMEIDTNYEILNSLESLRGERGYNRNFYGINNKNFKGTEDEKKQLEVISDRLKNVNLGRVFWMDSLGTEKTTWNSSSVKVEFEGNYSNRDYFKKIVNGQSYSYKNDSQLQFFVEPIISRISGQFRTDISIPSRIKESKVAVISFRLKSLSQAKVPPGYTFAMVNNDGDVLYHSDSEKNLNENLFNEFSDPLSLKYSIKTKSDEPFNTQYYGREYNVLVRPVRNGLPYNLVILEDLAFEEYRDVNVFSFTVSMQVMIFMLLVIQILLMFFASAKRSLFKNKIFETDWIGPKKASNWEYICATAFNIAVFANLCSLRNAPFLLTIFMLVSVVSSIPIFLNLLFVRKYMGEKKSDSTWYKAKASAWGSAVLFLTNAVAFYVLEKSWTAFWKFEFRFILAPAVLLLMFHWLFCPPKDGENIFTRIVKFNQSYTSVLFSWMLVAMGLPILIFFRASYNYDQHLIARYNQTQLANASAPNLHSKYNRLEKSNFPPYSPSDESLLDIVYRDSLFVSNVSIMSNSGRTGSPYILEAEKSEYSKAIRLLQFFHIYGGESIVDYTNLNKLSSGNAHFNQLMEQVVSLTDTTITYFKFGDKYLRLSSASLNFHKPKIDDADKFWWLLFIVILVAFFFVLYGLINKIFAIKNGAEHSDNFNKINLINMLSENHVFLIGFLKIGKYELIDYLTDASKIPEIKRVVFDFSQMLDFNGELTKGNWEKLMSESYKDKYRLVVITNFEYGLKNVKASYFKLSLLESLLNKTSKTKILIQSTIHPGVMLDVMVNSGENNNLNQAIERWHGVFGKFRIELDQVSRDRTFNMLNITPGEGNNDVFIYESLVSFYHFYFSIWQSLTKEEKFFMYDLAEDGLVNCYDKYTFSSLLNKGLIVYKNGRIRLFTKGFRNFIIAGLGEVEMEKLIEKINDNRHWNKTRLPLVIISLAILLFILSSQHETSTKLITTLGALSAAIPALINFLSTLGGVNSTKR